MIAQNTPSSFTLSRLLLVLALVGAVALVIGTLNPGPAVLAAVEGGTQVRFSADQRWRVLPEDCVTVAWDVAGVSAVYLDGEGVVGADSRTICPAPGEETLAPVLHIVTPEGASYFYQLRVPAAILRGEWWLAVAGIVALLVGAVYTGISPALFARRRWIAAGALLLAALGIVGWLAWQFFNPAPMVIRTVTDGGYVSFSATPVRPPDACSTLDWAVEGIQEVQLNARSVVGDGREELCDAELSDLSLKVTFQNGNVHEYRFPPNRLLYPGGLLFLIVAIVSLVGAVDVVSGAKLRLAIHLNRYDAAGVFLVLVFSILLLGYVLIQAMQTTDDLWTQIHYASRTLETGTITRPNPLFLINAIMFHALSGGLVDFSAAVALVALGGYVLLALVLYGLLRMVLGAPSNWIYAGAYGLAVMALVIMEPIGLPLAGLDNWNARFAYILNNAYHNGPLPLVKPFAVIQFLYAVWVFRAKTEPDGLVLPALMAIAAVLAKPSYLIVLLPVLGVAVLYRLWCRQTVDWGLLFAVGGAGILPLAWLYYYNYASPTGDAGISFAPFLVYRFFAPDPWYVWLGPFMLLSLAFPLWVYVTYFKEARHSVMLNLAWLSLIVGQGYYLLLTEGELSAGNFRWGAQIALLILYVASFLFVAKRFSAIRQTRAWIAFGILALHLVSGLYAYRAYILWVWSWIR